jgi:hypothetical protein
VRSFAEDAYAQDLISPVGVEHRLQVGDREDGGEARFRYCYRRDGRRQKGLALPPRRSYRWDRCDTPA